MGRSIRSNTARPSSMLVSTALLLVTTLGAPALSQVPTLQPGHPRIRPVNPPIPTLPTYPGGGTVPLDPPGPPDPPDPCVLFPCICDDPSSCPGDGGNDGQESTGEAEDLADHELEARRENGGFVHAFSGEVTERTVDLVIPGRGFDFVWERTYRSREGETSALGANWDFSYNLFIETESGHVIVHDGRGRQDVYEPKSNCPAGTSSCWEADGLFRRITTKPDGSGLYTLTFPDQTRWVFHGFIWPDEPPGKIKEIVDRNGNTMEFHYDGQDRLVRIEDTLHEDNADEGDGLPREITLTYDDGINRLTSLMDWTGREVRYFYYSDGSPNGSEGDLARVRSPLVVDDSFFALPPGDAAHEFPFGKLTSYTYTQGSSDDELNHNLLSITRPNEHNVLGIPTGDPAIRFEYSDITNDANPGFDRVTTSFQGSDPSGDEYEFNYIYNSGDVSNPHGLPDLTVATLVNDRLGNVEELFYDSKNRLVRRREYTGRAPDPRAPTTLDDNRPVNKLRASDPDYFDTDYEYGLNGLANKITYPNGNVEIRDYEAGSDQLARGNLRARVRNGFPGDEHAALGESMDFHTTYNVVTRFTDPRGNRTDFAYDGNGNLKQIDHPEVYVGALDHGDSCPGSGIQCSVETFTYNSHGQLLTHTQPDTPANDGGRVDSFTYYYGPGSGRDFGYLHEEIVDSGGLGLTTVYDYDHVGNVLIMTSPKVQDETYMVNQLAQVVRTTSRPVSTGINHREDVYFDANDNVVAAQRDNKDEIGNPVAGNPWIGTTMTYGILDQLLEVREEVDEDMGGVIEVTTTYAYDANLDVALVSMGEATAGNQSDNQVATSHDERGLLFRRTRAPGSSDPSTDEFAYDGNGNLASLKQGTEGSARETQHLYDGYNRLLLTVDAAGNQHHLDYDQAGNLEGERLDGEAEQGVPTSFTTLFEADCSFDERNRLWRESVEFFDSNGVPLTDGNSLTEFFHDGVGNLERVRNDRGKSTNLTYDTADRPLRESDAEGNTRTFTYDPNSNVTMIRDVDASDFFPAETFDTLLSYDGLDRLTSEADNLLNTHSYAYDSRDNVVTHTDPRGYKNHFEYDGLDRLLETRRSVTSVHNIVTLQSWDDSSRLVGRTDGNGNAATYAYDALDRLVSVALQDGTSYTTQYDVRDNPIMQTDANGTVVSSFYDALDRLTTRVVNVGTGVSADTTWETYAYDGMSRLVRAADSDTTVEFEHDSLSNITRESLSIDGETALAFNSAHDGVGNRTGCTYPSGRLVSTLYDNIDRPMVISDPAPLAQYGYIGKDRVVLRGLVNGLFQNWGYDGARRCIGAFYQLGPGGLIFDYHTQAWDENSNRTSFARFSPLHASFGLGQSFKYDRADRLVESTRTGVLGANVEYELDDVGNRIGIAVDGAPQETYAMNPGDYEVNQYSVAPAFPAPYDESRDYDDNGNLVQRYDASIPQNIADITYDYRNRMVAYHDAVTGESHTYSYDALGRRVRKTLDVGVTALETRYHYDGWQVCEERNALGIVTASYVYGRALDEVLRMDVAAGSYFYAADDMGNVQLVTGPGSVPVEVYAYDDFGRPIVLDGLTYTPVPGPTTVSPIGNPYMFNGRRYDPETGFYYYRNRYMDPVTGRFTTRDPLGMWTDGVNLGNGTTYVGNNPWSRLDPMGLWSFKKSAKKWWKKTKKKWKEFDAAVDKRMDAFFDDPLGAVGDMGIDLMIWSFNTTEKYKSKFMDLKPVRWVRGRYHWANDKRKEYWGRFVDSRPIRFVRRWTNRGIDKAIDHFSSMRPLDWRWWRDRIRSAPARFRAEVRWVVGTYHRIHDAIYEHGRATRRLVDRSVDMGRGLVGAARRRANRIAEVIRDGLMPKPFRPRIPGRMKELFESFKDLFGG